MNYKIITPIRFFKYTSGYTHILDNNLTLITATSEIFIQKFNDMAFFSQVGVISSKRISECDCYLFESNFEKADLDISVSDANMLLHEIGGMMEFYTNALWLVKDNSCFCLESYMVSGDYQFINTVVKNVFASNAKGEYSTVAFDQNDLESAINLTHSIRKIATKSNVMEVEIIDNVEFHPGVNGTRSLADDKFNRIERAFHLVVKARMNSVLTEKISFYVAALEALFTTDNFEVKYKVAQRATLFLGGNSNEMLENKKLIEICYKIRSNYFHGGNQDKKLQKRETLQNISVQMDCILRRFFIKILTGDPQIFLNEDGLANWFEELLYSNWIAPKSI